MEKESAEKPVLYPDKNLPSVIRPPPGSKPSIRRTAALLYSLVSIRRTAAHKIGPPEMIGVTIMGDAAVGVVDSPPEVMICRATLESRRESQRRAPPVLATHPCELFKKRKVDDATLASCNVEGCSTRHPSSSGCSGLADIRISAMILESADFSG